jgi:hypothetical protein
LIREAGIRKSLEHGPVETREVKKESFEVSSRPIGRLSQLFQGTGRHDRSVH